MTHTVIYFTLCFIFSFSCIHIFITLYLFHSAFVNLPLFFAPIPLLSNSRPIHLSLSVSHSLSLYISPSLYLSLSTYLFYSISHPNSLFLSTFLSHCLSLSLSFCLLSFYFSFSLSLSHFLTLLCVSFSL